MEFINSIYDFFAGIWNFITMLPDYFMQFFQWLSVWYVKMKLYVSIEFLKIAYLVAVEVLDDIGFTTLFQSLFNQLPAEIRYYAHLFRIPDSVTLFFNLAVTSLVLRFTK